MTRLVADAVLIGIVLFGAAGTLAWWRAWVLLAVLLLVRVVGALVVHRVNPDLLEERASLPIHGDQPRSDTLLLFAVLATGFIGVPVVAALDVFQWHVLSRPVPSLASVGLGLFVLGWGLKNLALRANAFATPVVRIQRERAHVVIDSGVYGIVRHPFYAADPLIFAGLGLWLESYTATLFAVVPIACMAVRLRLEEQFLQRELPGYREYSLRVPHRLLPGIW